MLSGEDVSVKDLLDFTSFPVATDWSDYEKLVAIKAAIAAGDDDDDVAVSRSESLMSELRRMAADAKLRDETVDDEIPESKWLTNGHQVVPALDPKKATGGKKEIWKSWEGIAGAYLPLVQRGDVGGHVAALVARWPHFKDVLYQVCFGVQF